MSNLEITMPFLAAKDAFMDVVAEGKPAPANWNGHQHARTLERMAANPYEADRFYADSKATPSQLLGWMRNGYTNRAMEAMAGVVKTERKAREVYDDFEGDDLDLDRLFSGDTNFLVTSEPHEVKPGLTVNVEMNFNGLVSADTIGEYGGWIASFVEGLEIQGYDMEINIVSTTSNPFERHRGNVKSTLNVKAAGEQSRFTAWSCLFAPGAYRSLVWTAEMMGAAKVGKIMTSGMGMAETKCAWSVNFDREANTVTLNCNGNARAFDGAKMTADAKKHGLI